MPTIEYIVTFTNNSFVVVEASNKQSAKNKAVKIARKERPNAKNKVKSVKRL